LRLNYHVRVVTAVALYGVERTSEYCASRMFQPIIQVNEKRYSNKSLCYTLIKECLVRYVGAVAGVNAHRIHVALSMRRIVCGFKRVNRVHAVTCAFRV